MLQLFVVYIKAIHFSFLYLDF